MWRVSNGLDNPGLDLLPLLRNSASSDVIPEKLTGRDAAQLICVDVKDANVVSHWIHDVAANESDLRVVVLSLLLVPRDAGDAVQQLLSGGQN